MSRNVRMSFTVRNGVALAIAMFVIVTTAACSASTESNVRPLDDRFRITIESGAIPGSQSLSEAVIIYLVQDPDLVRRTRVAAAPVTPESVLSIVAKGATDREREEGIRSALGSTTLVIESLSTQDQKMVIDLATGFTELPGEEQTLLIGQVVLSMFENFRFSSIEITVAGEPTAVLGPGGEVIERPILPSDFRPLVVNLR